MPYERHHQPLLPRRAFVARVTWHAVLAGGVIVLSLALGAAGYHSIAGFDWIDAIENAAMILTGMGPVSPMPSDGAKLFASAYALFSGVVFVTSVGVVITPMLHRLLHYFHLEGKR
jgi:hypothetical protein